MGIQETMLKVRDAISRALGQDRSPDSAPPPADPAAQTAAAAQGMTGGPRGQQAVPSPAPPRKGVLAPATLAVLAVAGALGFLLLADPGVLARLGLEGVPGRFRPWGGLLFLGSVVLGLVLLVAWLARGVTWLFRAPVSLRGTAVLIGVEVALLGFLVAAVAAGHEPIEEAGALALVGSLALLFGDRFFRAVDDGDSPRVETHWGGLGGTLGGWTFSRSAVYLTAAMVFGALATGVVLYDREARNDETRRQAAGPATPRPDTVRSLAAGAGAAPAGRPAIDTATLTPPSSPGTP